MIDDNRAKARIIDYWRAVELFSPQSVPRVNLKDENELVVNLVVNSIPPWHPDHPLQKRIIPKDMTWLHQVYCGIFDLEEAVRLLEETVGREINSPGEYLRQESAVCTFTVSNNGLPLNDSLVISTCPWATARTLDPGPQSPNWLSGFDDLAEKIAIRFPVTQPSEPDDLNPETDELSKLDGDSVQEPWVMSVEDVYRVASQIVVLLGAQTFIKEMFIRVKSYRVSRRREDMLDDVDSLNSFFVNDLDHVKAAVSAGNLGQGLSELLSDRSHDVTSRRIDVRENPAVTYKMLSPAQFPHGRWPSRGKSPLFLSQQLAVNHISSKLNSRAGLSSVNGPPGTGKTTLIRELVAFVVVERAKKLASLGHYNLAFTGQAEKWADGAYTRSVSFWHESLTQFEIVIASNNNGAVENVVLEIPGIGAVDPSYTGEDDYFAGFAKRLLDAPAWALVATRLGNRTNRNAFANQFWYSGSFVKPDEPEQESSSFLDYLSDRKEGALEWEIAVDRFKKIIKKEAQQRERRLKVYKLVTEIVSLRDQLADITQKLDQALDMRESIREEMRVAEGNQFQTTSELGAIIDERLLHQKFRPGLWQIIFTLGKALRSWQEKDRNLEALIDNLRAKQRDLNGVVNEIQDRLSEMGSAIERMQDEWASTEDLFRFKSGQVDEAEKWLGPHLLRPEILDDAELRERAQPWSDPEWNETRAQVFLEALRLHKTFIQCNAWKMRNNLFAAMDIISGKAPKNLSPLVAQHAWASLFFVIPVISTTFASFDRLFRHLGREQLGWLIVDEAGQATPQSAAGAVWRSKRTVALGDPLQLEPVITLPISVQEALRKHFRVDEKWIPERTSLQQLADEVNPVGSFVDLRNGSLWVGAPLRVHKRCDRPMFDISNRVAYGGQMVFDTPSRGFIDLKPSTWIDIISNENNDHWVPAEGEALHILLEELLSHNMDLDKVMVLAPFRAVARQLYVQTRKYKVVEAGTIHIAQGKEADVVILVLGGNPERPGAFRWASARPNLINVAVSRAKRRLYVIGNKKIWANYPYFNDLASILNKNALM